MNVIVAVDKNWGIGNNNNLLFHISEDMKFFKEKTINNIVVMGRKTLESFPKGNPLKDRINIVLTTDKSYSKDNVVIINSIDDLMLELRKYNSNKIFVIGGGSIYKQLLKYCDTAYVTKINDTKKADTFFPNLDKEQGWKLTEVSETKYTEKTTFNFCTYRKI